MLLVVVIFISLWVILDLGSKKSMFLQENEGIPPIPEAQYIFQGKLCTIDAGVQFACPEEAGVDTFPPYDLEISAELLELKAGMTTSEKQTAPSGPHMHWHWKRAQEFICVPIYVWDMCMQMYIYVMYVFYICLCVLSIYTCMYACMHACVHVWKGKRKNKELQCLSPINQVIFQTRKNAVTKSRLLLNELIQSQKIMAVTAVWARPEFELLCVCALLYNPFPNKLHLQFG